MVQQQEVNLLVEELRANKIAKRREASIKLSRLAASAVPHLHAALRRDDLDTEQIARIRTILSKQSRIDEDTPSSLAFLLSTDHQHWQMIARRMDRQQWMAANDHIRNCGLQTLGR